MCVCVVEVAKCFVFFRFAFLYFPAINKEEIEEHSGEDYEEDSRRLTGVGAIRARGQPQTHLSHQTAYST